MSHPLSPLAGELAARGVRYVVIGVSGANLYGPGGQAVFTTDDFDLFMPLDADNLGRAWEACGRLGFDLWLGDEPLDRPRDRWLADRIIDRRALTRATGPNDLIVDLGLVMVGFDFEKVWMQTARLLHIVESKQAAGRPKDQLFLATHKDALEQLFRKPD